MSMPKTIVLPNADDFCRYRLFEGKKCCFIGWRIKLLPKMNFKEECDFSNTAQKVAKQMKLKLNHYSLSDGVGDYNDCYENSDRRLATWFRKTIEKLGYDIK